MAEKDKDPDATARLAIGLVVTAILGWMAFGPDRSEAHPVSNTEYRRRRERAKIADQRRRAAGVDIPSATPYPAHERMREKAIRTEQRRAARGNKRWQR